MDVWNILSIQTDTGEVDYSAGVVWDISLDVFRLQCNRCESRLSAATVLHEAASFTFNSRLLSPQANLRFKHFWWFWWSISLKCVTYRAVICLRVMYMFGSLRVNSLFPHVLALYHILNIRLLIHTDGQTPLLLQFSWGHCLGKVCSKWLHSR